MNGVGGGNSTVGTIDATGKYNAPQTLPSPNSVTDQGHQRCRHIAFGNQLSLTLQNPIPVLQSVNSHFLPVGNFLADGGRGSNFVSGSQVMFGGTALTTTYRRPHPAYGHRELLRRAQTGTVKITVQNPDPGKIESQRPP